jgi:hypothetical protein
LPDIEVLRRELVASTEAMFGVKITAPDRRRRSQQ